MEQEECFLLYLCIPHYIIIPRQFHRYFIYGNLAIKPNNMHRISIVILLSLILMGCSGEGETPSVKKNEETGEETNTKPIISDQDFDVDENSIGGTSIGTIVVSDADGDTVQFVTRSVNGFSINGTTGELKVSPQNDNLDFEGNGEITIDVTITDGKIQSTGTITLNIIDVEDGPLTNFEKEVVESFIFQVPFDETEFPLFKRTENVKLFLSGKVTNNLKDVTQLTINEYNELFLDGFEMGIIEDSLSANVQLYSSTVEELGAKWPEFHELALQNPGLGGIAGGTKIWIADYAHNIRTVKHEMGHIIGLGHSPSSQCNSNDDNSIMCGGVGKAGLDFSDVDRKLINYYYHPNMPDELPGNEVEARLTEIILSER